MSETSASSVEISGICLGELAERFGLELRGDARLSISGVCALMPGRPGHISFCADAKLRAQLGKSAAAAVVVSPRDATSFDGHALIAAEPALAFSKIAGLFDRSRNFAVGVDASAHIAGGARLGVGVGVAAGAVIEAGVTVGDGSYIGPGCVIRAGAQIGAHCRLEANVYIGLDCVVGDRGLLHPGAVVGGRGFGLVPSRNGWIEMPQLGRVIIGCDVEIGANTCIDRGALEDTVIEDGVKLDNQIQIAHNCRIGANTAIAACVGIAGSTQIGRRCMIGGAAGIGGHLTIADDVVILGRAMVTKSIVAAGVYGSGLPALPAREWRKQVARVRRLEGLDARIAAIEELLRIAPPIGEGNHDQGDF